MDYSKQTSVKSLTHRMTNKRYQSVRDYNSRKLHNNDTSNTEIQQTKQPQ